MGSAIVQFEPTAELQAVSLQLFLASSFVVQYTMNEVTSQRRHGASHRGGNRADRRERGWAPYFRFEDGPAIGEGPIRRACGVCREL